MYHYMQFDPYLDTVVRERHEQMRAEMSKRRLVKQLRKNHKEPGSRLAAFKLSLKSTLYLLRKAH